MTVSKAQQNATNKWIAKAYDRINLTIPKGQKERIKAHADSQGESVNAFIFRAISETIDKDLKQVTAQDIAEDTKMDGAYKPLSEQEFEEKRQEQLAKLQAAAGKK